MQNITQAIATYAASKNLTHVAVLETYYGSGNEEIQGTDLISVEGLDSVLETLDKDTEGYTVTLCEEHNAVILKNNEDSIVDTIYVLIANEDEEVSDETQAYADNLVRGR
jgi:hypothetical protein